MRLGIDIGGTKTEAVAIDDGEVVHRCTFPTGYGAPAVVQSVIEAAQRIRAMSGLPFGAFSSIGVGIPGHVDNATGVVSHAVNLGLETLQFGAILSDRMGVPIGVENDVKAAALGADYLLAPAVPNDNRLLAYLNLGTGLAAGLVHNGTIWRGTQGVAGEIGHIPVQPSGALCACGQRGCLETLASGSAIERHWPTDNSLPAHALSKAAAHGDPEAVRVIGDFYDGVAAAVRILVLAAGVDTVVIGGGLAALGGQLLDGIQNSLERSAAQSRFIASLGLHNRISLLPPHFPAPAVGAALIGAAHYARDHEETLSKT